MDESRKIMRVEIGGDWTADDMIRSFTCLRDLYNLRLILQFEYEDWREWREFYREVGLFPPFRKRFPLHLSRHPELFNDYPSRNVPLSDEELSELSTLFFPDESLNVRRIKYGSDGIKDLAGIGVIVGHVKDFVLDLVRLRVEKPKRDLENEEREIKNKALRIENARSFVRLADELGYKKSQIRKLVKLVDDRQDGLQTLIDEGKVRDVKLLESSEEGDV